MCRQLSLRTGLLLLAILVLPAGCRERHCKVKEHREVVIERTEYVPAPPPQEVIVEQPPPAPVVVAQPPPPAEVVIIQQAPPPVIVETPPPPVVGMVWIGGYWTHEHGHYNWCKGRYVKPVPGCRLEPARWEHTNRGWQFHRENWGRHESQDDRSPRDVRHSREAGQQREVKEPRRAPAIRRPVSLRTPVETNETRDIRRSATLSTTREPRDITGPRRITREPRDLQAQNLRPRSKSPLPDKNPRLTTPRPPRTQPLN